MKRRVLIVDDSLTVRMDLSELIEESGFEVSPCDSLSAARESLSVSLPDVIVLDVQLPDGNGIEFLREIKSSPRTATVGVILLSTLRDVEEQLRGLNVGADEYIGKPYDRRALLSRVNELSKRRRAATVLVIDDSLTYRERLREILEASGYAVVSAETGEEGLHLAFAHRPTAMIVDYQLPGMQGDAVIRRIRQESQLRRTPTLLLTASEDPLDQLRALEAGADTFVRKDQDTDVLLACLNSIVRSASTPDAIEDNALPGSERVAILGEGSLGRELVAELQNDSTVQVLPRENFASAIEQLHADCVILDSTLSKASDAETDIQLLKQNQELGDARVIVVGEGDDRARMMSFMNAGADDYISSSAGAQVIAARVRAHLRRKRLEDENRSIREHILRNRLIAETQKELAQAAAVRNEELQQLAETIPAIVWTSHADGQLTYCNTRWYEYTGLSPEDTLRDGWALALHPEDKVQTLNAFRISYTTGKPFQSEFRVRGVSGHHRWFLGRALPVRSHGKITRWFGTAIDIHERHETEEALRRSEKVAATGRLAASIAHEINNPLEAVVNVLYLLPSAIRANQDEALKYVDIAQQEIGRVSHITRQTLAFYRDTGEAAEIDICPLVAEVVQVYATKSRASKVRIETQLDCDEKIVGFTGEVRQVIGNLVANAIEASTPGECVIVKVRPGWDWQTGQRGIRVLVHDHGRGISAEFSSELFKPFATTKGQKGTGLGLWVTHSIVEKHGGTIRFRSSTRAGKSGTTFSVFFPSASAPSGQHQNEMRGLFGSVARELLSGESS